MSNKKQTAVNWLIDKLLKGEYINNPNELIKQAKEMEKKQIIEAYNKISMSTPEKYYKETYEND